MAKKFEKENNISEKILEEIDKINKGLDAFEDPNIVKVNIGNETHKIIIPGDLGHGESATVQKLAQLNELLEKVGDEIKPPTELDKNEPGLEKKYQGIKSIAHTISLVAEQQKQQQSSIAVNALGGLGSLAAGGEHLVNPGFGNLIIPPQFQNVQPIFVPKNQMQGICLDGLSHERANLISSYVSLIKDLRVINPNLVKYVEISPSQLSSYTDVQLKSHYGLICRLAIDDLVVSSTTSVIEVVLNVAIACVDWLHERYEEQNISINTKEGMEMKIINFQVEETPLPVLDNSPPAKKGKKKKEEEENKPVNNEIVDLWNDLPTPPSNAQTKVQAKDTQAAAGGYQANVLKKKKDEKKEQNPFKTPYIWLKNAFLNLDNCIPFKAAFKIIIMPYIKSVPSLKTAICFIGCFHQNYKHNIKILSK